MRSSKHLFLGCDPSMLVLATHSSSFFVNWDNKTCLSCQHWRGGASPQIWVQTNYEIIVKSILTGVVRWKCYCVWVPRHFGSGYLPIICENMRTHVHRHMLLPACVSECRRKWCENQNFPPATTRSAHTIAVSWCVFNDLLGGICRVIVGSLNIKTLFYLKEPTMTQQMPAANHKKRMVKLTFHVHHG